jgi:hypothetical protein
MDKNYNRRQNNPFLPNDRNNASMGRSIGSINNQDLMGISPSKKGGDQQQKQYGMSQQEINEITFDLAILDDKYIKWA